MTSSPPNSDGRRRIAETARDGSVEGGIVFALDGQSYFFFIRIIDIKLRGKRVKHAGMTQLDAEIARHSLHRLNGGGDDLKVGAQTLNAQQLHAHLHHFVAPAGQRGIAAVHRLLVIKPHRHDVVLQAGGHHAGYRQCGIGTRHHQPALVVGQLEHFLLRNAAARQRENVVKLYSRGDDLFEAPRCEYGFDPPADVVHRRTLGEQKVLHALGRHF